MIGIVGGVGPYAGLDLSQKIFDNTIANCDQDHLDLIMLSLPSSIIDRTEYINDTSLENPGKSIATVVAKLESFGAKVVGLPCNTAHAEVIFSDIESNLAAQKCKVEVLNMVEQTLIFIKTHFPEIKEVGILSTTGTYKTKIYAKHLVNSGYKVHRPPFDMQEKIIHPAIYDLEYGIKSNPQHAKSRSNLEQGLNYLKNQGAELIILGCTEIPLVIKERQFENIPLIDPTNILARALIGYVNTAKLKPYSF
ncbi:MAG: amino acid racemase [Flavobacteriaceae bacterium]|nr:amino acid racemase [Flavobacteriaceae bacterium]